MKKPKYNLPTIQEIKNKMTDPHITIRGLAELLNVPYDVVSKRLWTHLKQVGEIADKNNNKSILYEFKD